LQKRNAVVLGCSADKPEAQAKFKKRWKLNFSLLSDTEKKTLAAYGVWQQKSFLGKKYMGVVRWTFVIGPDGRIRKIFQKVRPGRHVPEVLAALD
jgi:peroxiredoxin Q/BCP